MKKKAANVLQNVSLSLSKDTSRNIEKDRWQETHQRSVWSCFSPAERLHRSWSLRRLLKDKRSIHDKKLFPHP